MQTSLEAALTLYRQGDKQEAFQKLHNLAQVSPTDINVLWLLAVTASDIGNTENAIDALHKLRRLRPAEERFERLLSHIVRSAPRLAPQYADSMVGIVSDIEEHRENFGTALGATMVWRFTVQPHTKQPDNVWLPDGPPRTIQMRGRLADGRLQNGEWVEVSSVELKRNRPKCVQSLATGQTVVLRAGFWRTFWLAGRQR